MSEKIYYLMQAVMRKVDGGYLFIAFLGLELALFITVLLFSVLKDDYKITKRAWYFCLSTAIIFLELAFMSLNGTIELFYLLVGITLLFYTVTICIPTKNAKVKNSQRELARLIDQSVKMATEKEKPELEKIEPTVEEEQDASINDFELDFQHVKLVIQKLEYYPLTASDKKVVRELEDSIYQAQTYGFTHPLKIKINDGLGALLKIMSKHGV
jgi:Ca2+/Na+ antiporter